MKSLQKIMLIVTFMALVPMTITYTSFSAENNLDYDAMLPLMQKCTELELDYQARFADLVLDQTTPTTIQKLIRKLERIKDCLRKHIAEVKIKGAPLSRKEERKLVHLSVRLEEQLSRLRSMYTNIAEHQADTVQGFSLRETPIG